MSAQQTLHEKASGHLEDLKRIVDQLKGAGECPLDGWNALMNIQARAIALSSRCDVRGDVNGKAWQTPNGRA